MLFREPFSEGDIAKISTFREVKVFWTFYMKTNLLPFKNSSILQYTDNKLIEHILTFGSRNPEIQCMVYNIVMKYRPHGITAVWMSREEEEMKLADAGSRGP